MNDTQQMQHDLRRLANELRKARCSLDRAGAFDDVDSFEEESILEVEEELLEMAQDLWIESNLQELATQRQHAAIAATGKRA